MDSRFNELISFFENLERGHKLYPESIKNTILFLILEELKKINSHQSSGKEVDNK